MKPPIKGPRDRHPSGRPIRNNTRRDFPGSSVRNDDTPMVPGLRRKNATEAIGFLANRPTDEDDG
jgi:hypothetical protein